MITRLEQEAAEEADAKAFCDKEMSETKAKKEDKEKKEALGTAQEVMGGGATAWQRSTGCRW